MMKNAVKRIRKVKLNLWR